MYVCKFYSFFKTIYGKCIILRILSVNYTGWYEKNDAKKCNYTGWCENIDWWVATPFLYPQRVYFL